jgi:pimeloyl-ACP methyl ester carboxylesterase
MNRNLFFRAILAMLVASWSLVVHAEEPAYKIGIVIMHGKGGAPSGTVAALARALGEHGMLVANLDMPWSGHRDYDTNVAGAEAEVEAALASLKAKGATRLFVAGHSQGGVFALYFASKHAIDGVIAIAPGGNVGGGMMREKLADSLELARKMIADGKGDEKTRFFDFEGSKGSYPIVTTAANYISWIEPSGAMNQSDSEQALPQSLPVLFIVPTNDMSGLLASKQKSYGMLPANPMTKLYEPSASHLGAPSASIDEIVEWTAAVANTH